MSFEGMQHLLSKTWISWQLSPVLLLWPSTQPAGIRGQEPLALETLMTVNFRNLSLPLSLLASCCMYLFLFLYFVHFPCVSRITTIWVSFLSSFYFLSGCWVTATQELLLALRSRVIPGSVQKPYERLRISMNFKKLKTRCQKEYS